LNDPEAVDNEPDVAYEDALTLSIELLNAEPVTSKAVTLVLNDPDAADNDADVEYNEAEVALYAPVVAKAVLLKLLSKSALAAYDALVALAAAEPDITPVVIIAPDALIVISVFEPLTNLMFPYVSYCMKLVKPDAD
jgi:hypothetical protein